MPSAPDERKALRAACAIIAALVLVVVAVGATAAVSRDQQADAIEAILPVAPWTSSDLSRTACVFCKPQSVRVDLSGLPAATPEPELLGGLNARLGQAGYLPDEPWGCRNYAKDAERFLDPGEIPPPRLLRGCSRGYTSDDAFALVLVEYLEGNSATAWIDINRK